MTILKAAILIVIFITCGIFFTLFVNQANLFSEPGFSKRLAVFLTSNRAQTEDSPKFKELETPVYSLDASSLFKQVLVAAAELGWDIVRHNSDDLNVEIIVRSRLFLFEDDMFVQVIERNENISSLYIVSSSRKGRADFAANSGHIQALMQQVRANTQ